MNFFSKISILFLVLNLMYGNLEVAEAGKNEITTEEAIKIAKDNLPSLLTWPREKNLDPDYLGIFVQKYFTPWNPYLPKEKHVKQEMEIEQKRLKKEKQAFIDDMEKLADWEREDRQKAMKVTQTYIQDMKDFKRLHKQIKNRTYWVVELYSLGKGPYFGRDMYLNYTFFIDAGTGEFLLSKRNFKWFLPENYKSYKSMKRSFN